MLRPQRKIIHGLAHLHIHIYIYGTASKGIYIMELVCLEISKTSHGGCMGRHEFNSSRPICSGANSGKPVHAEQ